MPSRRLNSGGVFLGEHAHRLLGDGAFGRAAYVLNAYRVLLTRARQGMIIFIPPGDDADATRPSADYGAIDAWLDQCGIPSLRMIPA